MLRTDLDEIAYFADQIDGMLSDESDLTSVLGIIDETLMNLAQNATSSVSVVKDNVDINVILSNQSTLNSDELNVANNSDSNVEAVEIPDANTNASFAVVIAKLKTRKSVQQTRNNINAGKSETLLGIRGSTYTSINVFDRVNDVEVSARVTYTKPLSNIPTSVKEDLNPSKGLVDRKVAREFAYSCQFFEETSSTFSSTGCFVNISLQNSNRITCSCNHTTIFAVLLAVNNFVIPTEIRVSKFK